MDPSVASQRATEPVVDEADDALFRLITRKLLPLLILCYLIAFLDRVNIGYAELQMRKDLGFSDIAFATGAGMFFVGYVLFEIPSNMLLERIGARKTLLRIMVLWGLIAAGMAFVHTPTQFYVMRFLLGAFEAGFFPGVILYLTYWFPPARRGRVTALFLTATSLALVIAGPISGAILEYLGGVMSLKGWQWLFIVEGLPATVLGFVVYRTLADRPDEARWLSPAQKERLQWHLQRDVVPVSTASHGSAWGLLRDPRIYLLSLVYFMFLGATYGMIFWSPTLIAGWGVKNLLVVGLLGAVPALVSAVGMVLFGRSSDRRRERRWHFFAAAAICAAGIVVTIFTKGVLLPSLLGLCVMGIGQGSVTPLFFTAVSEYFPARTAAVGLALVSSIGNLGPAFLPPVLASIRTSTGGQTTALAVIAGLFLAAGLLFLVAIRANPVARTETAAGHADA